MGTGEKSLAIVLLQEFIGQLLKTHFALPERDFELPSRLLLGQGTVTTTMESLRITGALLQTTGSVGVRDRGTYFELLIVQKQFVPDLQLLVDRLVRLVLSFELLQQFFVHEVNVLREVI